MRAGVFDSGVGGLTVVKSILEEKLFDEIIYYGDTARVPYGPKDKNTIISYSLEALEFFKNFDIDMLIIACNSVSAYAIDELQKNTTIPVIGVIESGVLALKSSTDDKNSDILVIGTSATINSNLYDAHLRQLGYENIVSIPTPLFVPMVEEGIFDGALIEEAMKLYFKDVKKTDRVILGCTHFPLIENEISRFLNGTKTIHSGDAIVQLLKTRYDLKPVADTKISFFASSNPDNLKNVAKKWLNL
ncbi:MAG: glutamate racemase [Arcobacteraceae bacterium]|jgi:glutamate racemase